MRPSPLDPKRSFVTTKPVAPKNVRPEQAAAQAKAAAMVRHFGDAHISAAEPEGLAALEQQISNKVMAMVGQVPGLGAVPSLLNKVGRYGGPVLASAAFGFSAFDTVKHWHERSAGQRTIDVTATSASGVAAGGAIATLMGATGAAALVTPAAGIAGTLFAGHNAWKTMHDRLSLPGQKGMALASVGLQAVGTVMAFTPAAPVGIMLMLAGGSCGVFGHLIGQFKPINLAFKSIGL
ncbi:MAG: hypothetical protein JWM80_3650 [Cyanobacteria bacterium RYN_339]|nr:hypothetical protein [Cyanobacteria bacterium RYN_339]